MDGICRYPVRDTRAERFASSSESGQELIILAMVVTVELNELVVTGVGSRITHSHDDRLGATVQETHPLRTGHGFLH